MSKVRKSDLVKAPKEKKEELYPLTNQPILRPKINWFLVVLNVVLTLAADFLLCFGTIFGISRFEWYSKIKISPAGQHILLFFIILIVYMIIRTKSILIFFLHIYQRYMPYAVRCNCVYIPNCSQYMILALKRYGAIKGFRMGIARLKRCKEINGGYDYPWAPNPNNVKDYDEYAERFGISENVENKA